MAGRLRWAGAVKCGRTTPLNTIHTPHTLESTAQHTRKGRPYSIHHNGVTHQQHSGVSGVLRNPPWQPHRRPPSPGRAAIAGMGSPAPRRAHQRCRRRVDSSSGSGSFNPIRHWSQHKLLCLTHHAVKKELCEVLAGHVIPLRQTVDKPN